MPESDASAPETPATRRGFGRVLIALYALMAIAATARSIVQIVRDFGGAPVAYTLSACAAVVYIVATIALARGDRTSRRVALVAITIELIGVLTVGILSIADSAAFPRAAVWSRFGEGYLFLPLILPIAGLWWLRRTKPTKPTNP